MSSNSFLSIPPPPPPSSIPIAYSPMLSPVQSSTTSLNTIPNNNSSTASSSLVRSSASTEMNPTVNNNNNNYNNNSSSTTTLPTSPTSSNSITNDDDNKITINKREMRLGLRHRDSFAVHKQHLHQNPHGVHSNVNSMTNTVSITAPTMTRNSSDPSLRSHQSSMSQLFANIPASPSAVSNNNNNMDINDILDSDDFDLQGSGGNEEGGPDNDDDDDNTTVTIDPSNESDVLRVLESMAMNSPEQQAMVKAMQQEASDPNNFNNLSPEEQTRKKNKLKSVIKGVGSYLGLRKSKKKRLAEAAQAAALAGSMNGSNPNPYISSSTSSSSTNAVSSASSSSSSSTSSDSNLLKRLLFRSKSSPSLQNDDDRLRDPTSPLPALNTPPHHHHHHHSSSNPYSAGPNRDEYGMYLPNHRRDTPARGIVKSPNNVRRALDNSNMTSPGTKEKRRIAFIDIAYGEPLEQVRFCDDLHYSENSQHVDWDEEDDAAKCVIM